MQSALDRNTELKQKYGLLKTKNEKYSQMKSRVITSFTQNFPEQNRFESLISPSKPSIDYEDERHEFD
jgi:hypothetical protein